MVVKPYNKTDCCFPISKVLCVCLFPCAFGRLVTREQFGRVEAPLLLEVFKLSCLCSRSLPLCVRSSCDEGAIWACRSTSPPQSIWTFVFVFMFPSLVTREQFGRVEAPLLLKAFRLSCLCSRLLPCIRSSCDEGALWACPCTPHPHKSVCAFVNVCSYVFCVFALCTPSFTCAVS